MYAVTGATGQLGRLVLESLMDKVPPADIVALVRNDLAPVAGADRGVSRRVFDYDRPETLVPALQGVARLLLISSSAVGRRTGQHRAVIDAARQAGVGFIAYTSILRAGTNPMALALEHRETEAMIRDSGLDHVILRNGWYTENFTESAGPALTHGAWLGSGAEGRIASAARADYAEAAAVVLAGGAPARVLELAGDQSFTEADFAAALSKAAGRLVAYHPLSEADHAASLEQAGLPADFAAILADSSAQSAQGALFDDSRTLSRLIGRPTTDWQEMVRSAVTG